MTELWTANKYLNEPVGDGGRARVPSLWAKDEHGNKVEYNSNEEKADALARAFSPCRPETSVPEEYDYPEPLPKPAPIRG